MHDDKRYMCAISPSKKIAYVRVNGVNYPKHFFKFLKAKETTWIPIENVIPVNAIIVNLNSLDQPSYVIRARLNDSWIVTTLEENFNSHANFYGEEMLITECEILVSDEYL